MKRSCCMVLLSVCAAAPAYTQEQQGRSADHGAAYDIQQSANTAQTQNLFRGSKIIGADVKDPQDRKLGEIKDILLDSGRGEVAFVVVKFGGAMERLGSKYHPVPWKALQPGDDGKHYVLYADRETISKAPAFDERRWPDLADQKWSAEVDRYWSRMVGHAPPGSITTSPGAGNSGSSGGSDTTENHSDANRRRPVP